MKYCESKVIKLLIIISIVVAVNLNIVSTYYSRGYEPIDLDSQAKVIIEFVEDYDGSDIEAACDAAHTFKNKLREEYEDRSYFRIYENIWARPDDFRTKYARGSNTYPSYHTYRYQYPVFIGHGGFRSIIFSVTERNNLTDSCSKRVYFDNIVNDKPKVHFRNVGEVAHPLWMTAASCDTLYFQDTPYTDPGIEYFIRATFNGGAELDNLSLTYLHGFVGMRTLSMFELKMSGICSARIDIASNIFASFAEYLKDGKLFLFAWRDTVYDNQYRDYTLCCLWACHTWQLRNKAAAMYPIILGFNSSGNLRFIINYSLEKLYHISQGQPYMDPREAVEYIINKGWIPIVSWNYYYYPMG